MSDPLKTPPDFYDQDLEFAFCRNDLSAFIEKAFKIVSPGVKFLDNWHLHCIAEYLRACETRQIKRLIINIPPRSLKSISCSVAWPAWLLGKDPSTKIMCASYSGLLSIKHSVDCRHLISSEWYKKCFPNTMLAHDANQKSKFLTTARGHRIATSVGGTATGEGGNFLILDDPHSASEAQSKTIRESQLQWFDQSWATRLNDKKNDVMVVIMQRLHEKDMTGHLLEVGGWEHLCLPAISNETRTISIGNFKKQLKQGEILHAEREDKKSLDSLKNQMGSYAFAGQYMQSPAPDGGGIFKKDWIKLYNIKKDFPRFDCIIQSYDTAMTEKSSSDATAFTAWGIWRKDESSGYRAMLLDAWQERLAYPDLRRKAKTEYATRYGEGEGRRADYVLVEEKGSGISLLQDLQRVGIPVRKYNPGNADKVQRAHLVSYLFENGSIYFPESDRFPGKFPSWAEELIDQLILFPNADHDDYVDSVTQALRYLRDSQWIRTREDHHEEDPEPTIRINPYAS